MCSNDTQHNTGMYWIRCRDGVRNGCKSPYWSRTWIQIGIHCEFIAKPILDHLEIIPGFIFGSILDSFRDHCGCTLWVNFDSVLDQFQDPFWCPSGPHSESIPGSIPCKFWIKSISILVMSGVIFWLILDAIWDPFWCPSGSHSEPIPGSILEQKWIPFWIHSGTHSGSILETSRVLFS